MVLVKKKDAKCKTNSLFGGGSYFSPSPFKHQKWCLFHHTSLQSHFLQAPKSPKTDTLLLSPLSATCPKTPPSTNTRSVARLLERCTFLPENCKHWRRAMVCWQQVDDDVTKGVILLVSFLGNTTWTFTFQVC